MIKWVKFCKADLDILYQSSNRGTNNNNVALYDNDGKIFSKEFLFRPNINANLINLVLRDHASAND